MTEGLLKTILGGNVVRYYPALSKTVGGAASALMISQLLYWVNNEKMTEKLKAQDGWFYISASDMEEQTGLSKCEQVTARNKLLELGVIETKLTGRVPMVMHYKVNTEKLEEIIQLYGFPIIGKHENKKSQKRKTNSAKTSKLVVAKPDNFNTETIPETKTDIKTESALSDSFTTMRQLNEKLIGYPAMPIDTEAIKIMVQEDHREIDLQNGIAFLNSINKTPRGAHDLVNSSRVARAKRVQKESGHKNKDPRDTELRLSNANKP